MVQIVRKKNLKVLRGLETAIRELDGLDLRAGWFETAKYEDGTPVAYVASIHEFGDPDSGIPARPFMRPTIARKEGAWREFTTQQAKQIVAGNQNPKDMFEALGLNVSGEIARSITDVTAPPLKETTIKAKRRKMADQATVGSLDKPLVESGLMLASVTHTVGSGDE